MIQYKDFFPNVTNSSLLGIVRAADSFDAVVKVANNWAASTPVEVVNIETVLIPQYHVVKESPKSQEGVYTEGHNPTHWYQGIRIWYREVSKGY
ncbi:MAG: hypothetical protein AB8G95_06335 [Anaerolineae bacterium]